MKAHNVDINEIMPSAFPTLMHIIYPHMNILNSNAHHWSPHAGHRDSDCCKVNSIEQGSVSAKKVGMEDEKHPSEI